MPLDQTFLHSYQDKQPEWGFNGLGYIVYKRTYARPIEGENRTEEWWETIARCIDGANVIGAGLTQDESQRLFHYMWDLKCTVSGRSLWQLGTDNPLRLGGNSLVNCWFTNLAEPSDFEFLFNQLMLGGGVGFSVRQRDIASLPIVKQASVTHLDQADADFIVPDKREGWALLLHKVLDAFFLGESFTYSTMLVRPEGTPIKTFGGTASGPGILISGVQSIAKVLEGAEGRHLNTVEVLDIANIIGSIVVSGNVRRSAEIGIGDVHDLDYLAAKRFDLGGIPPWRAQSNNTVQVDSMSDIPDAFWEGYEGNGEAYGMFNLNASRKYARTGDIHIDNTIEGCNPCGEIPLANHESCNLAEIFLPNVESEQELHDISILLYKVQKAVSAMNYDDEQTNAITHYNMRLGLSVTGIAQALDKLDWLDATYTKLRKFDKVWSAERGHRPSVRLTTVKPSGTLSLLAGVTPGVHPGFSKFHIRRVRMSSQDTLVEYCRARGYPVEFARDYDGEEDPRTVVVSFPAKFSETTVLAKDLTAIEQMDLARRLQRVWADNAVSVTVYYRKEELPAIKAYLDVHWPKMKSISFLLHKDHGFDQAPMEEIDEETYTEMLGSLNDEHVHVSGFSSMDDAECATGACPIR